MLTLTLNVSVHTERHNVTLTGGTFDLFEGQYDGQNGFHTHLPVNVVLFTLTVTLTLGVNMPKTKSGISRNDSF